MGDKPDTPARVLALQRGEVHVKGMQEAHNRILDALDAIVDLHAIDTMCDQMTGWQDHLYAA